MKRLLWIVVMAAALFSAAEERVASLSPNLTETIVRLGTEEELVERNFLPFKKLLELQIRPPNPLFAVI